MPKARATRKKKSNLNTIRISYSDPVLPEGLTRKGRTTNKKYLKAKLLAKRYGSVKELANRNGSRNKRSRS